MKCLSCGADISADASICGYCNSSVPSSDQREHETIFARLRASDAFAAGSTPERLARLPKLGAIQKTFMTVFFVIFIGGAAFMSIAALSMAGVIGIFGGRAGGGAGATFSIIPLLFAFVPLGFIAIGVLMFRAARKKMNKFESDPALAIPVIVVDKRTEVWGGSGDSSAKTNYYVTCETEDGSRKEYQVWDGAMYGKTSTDDAGILFVRSGYGLDFDRVAM